MASKYSILIVGSSLEEHHFESCYSYQSAVGKASRLSDDQKTSVNKYHFDTQAERKAFIKGYKAGVGWNGDGTYFCNNPK